MELGNGTLSFLQIILVFISHTKFTNFLSAKSGEREIEDSSVLAKSNHKARKLILIRLQQPIRTGSVNPAVSKLNMKRFATQTNYTDFPFIYDIQGNGFIFNYHANLKYIVLKTKLTRSIVPLTASKVLLNRDAEIKVLTYL